MLLNVLFQMKRYDEAADYVPERIFAKKTGSEQFRYDWTGAFDFTEPTD